MSLVENAFDAESFRRSGHEIIDLLADHLVQSRAGNNEVLKYNAPKDELAFWSEYELSNPEQFIETLLERSINLYHPRYIGHQVAVPIPLNALMGLVSDFMNNGMGIYEMGTSATVIEKLVVDEISKALGYDQGKSGGFLTSGGTLANLTALLTARSSQNLTSHSNEQFILVSDQAHFCIDRAARTMGIPAKNVIKVRSNSDFTMDLSDLEDNIMRVINNDGKIVAVVACACSTSTGSYDDLDAIAGICERFDIWMHVDGAHGAAACFSKKYACLCSGIERADSIVLDGHKMMLTPALATAVLFKQDNDSYKAFQMEAAYLFESSENEWFNLTKRTYETTKYMMSIKLYFILKYYGRQILDDFLTGAYDKARRFAQIINAHPNFETAHEPMSNIVCFRYRPNQDSNLSEINGQIRKQLLEQGDFYIVQTQLGQEIYLRLTVMNPHTSVSDCEALLRRIEELHKFKTG